MNIIFWFLSFATISSALSETLLINSSKELEQELEQLGRSGNHVTLKLNSSVEYTLSRKNFILIRERDFTMTSSDSRSVYISCSSKTNRNEHQPTTGIVFLKSNVSIARVSFKLCGSLLNTLSHNITDSFNHSRILYYHPTHAAALLFIQSKVNMDNVTLDSSYGFAAIGFNIISSFFRYLNISQTSQYTEQHQLIIGSGILLHYIDLSESPTHALVSFNNTSFRSNTEQFNKAECIGNYYRQPRKHYPVMNAAALTILYTQKLYRVNIQIDQSTFFNNSGASAGAVLVVGFESPTNSTVGLKNTNFHGNTKSTSKKCHGIAIQLLWILDSNKNSMTLLGLLKITNAHFEGGNHKDSRNNSGAVYLAIYSSNITFNFEFKKLYFKNNKTPGISATCMYILLYERYTKGSSINVTMSDIIAINNFDFYNTPKSMFQFENIDQVLFNGRGIFENNFGSVIHGIESNVFLDGKMSFENNTGENGGAIRIEGNCQLNFMDGLKAEFIENRAFLSGGAIYVNSNSNTKCAIQPKGLSTFSHNLARLAGNSIFATPINRCETNGVFHTHFKQHYFNISHWNPDNSLFPVSTSPFQFFITYTKRNQTYYLDNFVVEKFPGENFVLTVRVIDIGDKNVFSFVNTEVLINSYTDTKEKVWLIQAGGKRALEGRENNPLNLSIHTTSEKVIDGVLVISVPYLDSKSYKIRIKPCPIGFSLQESFGSCGCSRVLDQLRGIKCLINDRLILRPIYTNLWIGIINNQTSISMNCPLSYCNNDPRFGYIKITAEGTMLKDKGGKEKIPFCQHRRTGPLCGKCIRNYSVVFGSPMCKKCSNHSLLTTIMYASVGIGVIFLLFALRLTLTAGTLNGIIFYAQVANAGLLELMAASYSGKSGIMKVVHQCNMFILSSISLNFGFSLCFYDGMNQLWKTGLALAFPVYLLTIVFILILISRHSTWLSNKTSHLSIQVLVTIVYLSFSNLLEALIDVFTPATIRTANKTLIVWYWDGSVEYMGKSHYPLIIVTILTVTLLIFPFIALLIFAKTLIRYSKKASFYLRPIHEAIHAPYKTNKQYWFVARLLLLMIIYLLYVVLRTKGTSILSITTASLLAAFLIGQALFRPFKTNILNLLDCWLMLNITLAYFTIWNNITFTFNVASAILTLGIIIVYHLLLAFGCVATISDRIEHVKAVFLYRVSLRRKKEETRVQLQVTGSYYNSCNEFREPLIGDANPLLAGATPK